MKIQVHAHGRGGGGMSKSKAQARREHIERVRAEHKRKERRQAIVMWGIGGLVIALIVGAVAGYLIMEAKATSLAAVKSYSYPGGQHVQTPVQYKQSPPVGGEHHQDWQNCGIYDQPIRNENAVHSLEHGAVWITYRPNLTKAEVGKLHDLARGQAYVLVSPFAGLKSKVTVQAWGKQLIVDAADDRRLGAFVKKYQQGPQTPERGAACTGKVGQPLS